MGKSQNYDWDVSRIHSLNNQLQYSSANVTASDAKHHELTRNFFTMKILFHWNFHSKSHVVMVKSKSWTNIIDLDVVMYRSTSAAACFTDDDECLSGSRERIMRWTSWAFLRLMQLINTTLQSSGLSALHTIHTCLIIIYHIIRSIKNTIKWM